METRKFLFRGRVNGVALQHYARRKAMDYNVLGYAQKTGDNEMTVVLQGEPGSINKIVEFLKAGPGIARVSEVEEKDTEPEEFTRFAAH